MGRSIKFDLDGRFKKWDLGMIDAILLVNQRGVI